MFGANSDQLILSLTHSTPTSLSWCTRQYCQTLVIHRGSHSSILWFKIITWARANHKLGGIMPTSFTLHFSLIESEHWVCKPVIFRLHYWRCFRMCRFSREGVRRYLSIAAPDLGVCSCCQVDISSAVGTRQHRSYDVGSAAVVMQAALRLWCGRHCSYDVGGIAAMMWAALQLWCGWHCGYDVGGTASMMWVTLQLWCGRQYSYDVGGTASLMWVTLRIWCGGTAAMLWAAYDSPAPAVRYRVLHWLIMSGIWLIVFAVKT